MFEGAPRQEEEKISGVEKEYDPAEEEFLRLEEKAPESKVTKFLKGLSRDKLRILSEAINYEGRAFYSFHVLDENEQGETIDILERILGESDPTARIKIAKALP